MSLSFTVRLNISFVCELDYAGLTMSSTLGLTVVALAFTVRFSVSVDSKH